MTPVWPASAYPEDADRMQIVAHRRPKDSPSTSALLCMLGALIVLPAVAQGIPSDIPPSVPDVSPSPEEQSPDEQAERLQNRAYRAIKEGDFEHARVALEELAVLQPSSFVVQYNLACVHARLSDKARAVACLHRAIELGFIDFRQLTTDPDLEPIRTEPGYVALIDKWDAVIKARADANLERTRQIYGDSYHYQTDDDRRLLYACAYDEQSFAIARDELSLLADWGVATIFHDLKDSSAPDPFVTVILPNRRDFLRWVAMTYGPAARNNFSGIGGAYDHDRKQLVAQDLGATLRHEFFHVLHWRSASRLGQQHPIWIQEGLCSLVEDYDIINGSLTPVPSWRTNTVKRILSGGKLTRIEELAAIPRDKFTAGGRTMARYAECRAIFLFLYERGTLGQWYSHYVAHFNEDPTGITSILETLDTDIDGANAMYRDWLKQLPTVPEPDGREGRVGLGIDVDPGEGDGPVVTQAVSGAARTSGVRTGDIIYAVNGRPTRDVFELVRVLGAYDPGAVVVLSVRRVTKHLTCEVRLIDLMGG